MFRFAAFVLLATLASAMTFSTHFGRGIGC
jgi:hypothetical protein